MKTGGISQLIMGLWRGSGMRKTFAFLVLGNIAAVLALSGQGLDCTNDLEDFMFCHFEGKNCSEYNMTLLSNDRRDDQDCVFKQCIHGQCCCSMRMKYLVSGDTYKATVWKEGHSLESKTISITDTIKPKRPTITSVSENNGIFKVVWLTNTRSAIRYSLTAEVTYHEKGSKNKVSETVNQTNDNGENSYELQDLKPSTTYLVSVRSYTHWSKMYSDSSMPWEFTTPMSSGTLYLIIVISLSVAAVLITGAMYGCYVKFKTKWWDSVAKCPNPKLLVMHAREHEILKPVRPIISSICVEPLLDDNKPWLKDFQKDSSGGSLQQSSGISTGSSGFSYAETEPVNIIAKVQEARDKALATISLISPFTANLPSDVNKDGSLLCAPCSTNDVMPEDIGSGSSGFMNRTYSILLPNCTAQIAQIMSEAQTQNQMPCDSGYQSSEGVTVVTTYQQTPVCLLLTSPPEVSSLIPTDMSYQPCNADSGTFSYADASRSSSISSGTNTTASLDSVSRVEAACETCENENSEQVVVCDENPCYGSVPACSLSFPPVDFDYQPFQSVVEQPGMSLLKRTSDGAEKHFGGHPEDLSVKTPQSLFNNQAVTCPINDGQCFSEPPRPFLSLNSRDKSVPIVTDSGYQCV
ncbi:LOW QUALITY PROTEIN: uncharacterized protein LOC109981021 [Xyrichtys novacula]|uniref:LOW QUALITY PROTEIN: uncharacterized protein LOC109981021 n=1 Tax=Xyrichtys novacula TaxID=13765 RepID=A0AAV1EJX7_XYRNO|nr:LOW QUALITY PROTEIN: uncharacterized protein LOC109981021 [Xyrichtys novacula]